MKTAFPQLLTWQQADPERRYATIDLHPGHGSPGVSIRLYEVTRDGVATDAKSVTEHGPACDAHGVLAAAIRRWGNGDFDLVVVSTRTALRPGVSP